MSEQMKEPEISAADLREALVEMGSYLDVTEEDLKNIYSIALRHARARSELSRKVSEIMTREVIVVRPDTAVSEAAGLLAEHGISGLPVTDDSGNVIGIITEADILSCAGIERRRTIMDFIKIILGQHHTAVNIQGCMVKDVMTTHVITVTTDADVRQAANLMAEKNIKRLPVLGSDNRLAGIVSRADIVGVFGISSQKNGKG